MPFLEDDEEIKAISADGSDQPFSESILPGGSSRYRAIAYAHSCDASNESVAIGAIAIANNMAWGLIPASRFGQLTSNPFGARDARSLPATKSPVANAAKTRSPYNC